MKKVTVLFMALLVVFCGTWIFKAKNPAETVRAYAGGGDDGKWWEKQALPVAEEEWTLDPEIPLNYLPVPGEEELYMVVEDNGRISGYRHRTRQPDGAWVWEDVNPDIPENYEAVEGLKDVYRVMMEDGSVKYFLYIRNEDDTFAFVEVDENGNRVEKKADGNVIPPNFVRITGNIYAVYNEHGVLIGYQERVANGDGSYTWRDCAKPEEPKQEPEGNAGSQPPPSGMGSEPSVSLPVFDPPTGTGSVPGSGLPDASLPSASLPGGGETSKPSVTQTPGGNTSTTERPDGNYIETETFTEIKVSGRWRVTYETKVSKTYDSSGKLLTTKKEGPTEISREEIIQGGIDGDRPDIGRIEAVLEDEYTRVSAEVNFVEDVAGDAIAKLNAERADAGLPALQSGGEADTLAHIRAADMALYNHADYNSPMYGTLDQMIGRYQISVSGASENLWKSSPKSADDIHTRFQVVESSRKARMSEAYTQIGIGIVEKNGYYYICEVLLA